MKRFAFAVASLIVGSTSALAITIDTYPYWDGNVTAGHTFVGQSFDAPDTLLTDYQFGINGNPLGGTLTIGVYHWIAGTGPTGSVLFSTSVAWPTVTGDVVLSGINVPMTLGGHYGVMVDLRGDDSQSVHWMNNTTGNPTGYGYWGSSFGSVTGIPGLSTKFRATFNPVPEPASLAVLGLGAASLIRRRRRTE